MEKLEITLLIALIITFGITIFKAWVKAKKSIDERSKMFAKKQALVVLIGFIFCSLVGYIFDNTPPLSQVMYYVIMVICGHALAYYVLSYILSFQDNSSLRKSLFGRDF